MQIIDHQDGTVMVHNSIRTGLITLECLATTGATQHWIRLSRGQAETLTKAIHIALAAFTHNPPPPDRDTQRVTPADVGNADKLLGAPSSSTDSATQTKKGA